MDPKMDLLNFWQAIDVLIHKPHVINKNLWGSIVLKRYYIKTEINNWNEYLADYRLNTMVFLNIDQYLAELSQMFHFQIVNEETQYEVIFIELLPKIYIIQRAIQMICINRVLKQVTFYDITPAKQIVCTTFPYTFFFIDNKITVKCGDSRSYQWLKQSVLPRLNKWSTEEINKQVQICNESLALVATEKYYTKYNLLKSKYASDMVKMWPESTDPMKFVYEDVAIATYLLLLWESYNEPQLFADVGCGNGLLVYILTMEGHPGFGVDVRKRKIWNMYPKNVQLKEYTVTPSNIDIFSNVDWVIGNHSDELTPWIPIIAAKTSYNCKFFLLPCCAYNLDGSKYNRKNSTASQYSEYLIYIRNLCMEFGFNTKTDRLKIPSTKRICFISEFRTYKENEYEKYLATIQEHINYSIGVKEEDGNASQPKRFKARDPVEKVRNCTQIDSKVIEAIVKRIANYLLEDCEPGQNWSNGKMAPLNELVQLIPPDHLKILKSECGGLQTLLRNHHSVFEVRYGTVQLRYPRSIEELKARKKKNNEILKIKQKECWFYKNHPQGCPLENALCTFVHEN